MIWMDTSYFWTSIFLIVNLKGSMQQKVMKQEMNDGVTVLQHSSGGSPYFGIEQNNNS